MIDSKINNFQGFLFERKKDKKSKKSNNDSSTKDVSNPKEFDSDKMKLILNPIIECISGSIQCIVSIKDLSITQTDNENIEKLKDEFQTIKNNIENFLSNKKIENNSEFIKSINEIKEKIVKEKDLINNSVMTEKDFINIKEKSLKNKSGEALESSIYSILKESFGLYQDAIENYINSLNEYLKIYIIKTR